MIYVVALVIGWLLAVLHTSAMPYVEVLGVTPDLTLIFASTFATLRRQEEALYVVPICGLLRDLAGSDPIGTSVVGFAPIVVLAAALRLRAMDSQFVPAIAVIAVGTLGHSVVTMTVLTVTGQEIEWVHGITRIIMPLVVVNSLFAAIVYIPVSWFRPPDRSPVLGPGRLTSPL